MQSVDGFNSSIASICALLRVHGTNCLIFFGAYLHWPLISAHCSKRVHTTVPWVFTVNKLHKLSYFSVSLQIGEKRPTRCTITSSGFVIKSEGATLFLVTSISHYICLNMRFMYGPEFSEQYLFSFHNSGQRMFLTRRVIRGLAL